MKRTGFKPKHPPRPPKVYETHTPRPREPLRVSDGKARMCVPVPKFAYVRDERLRAMCQRMHCQHCGSTDGVTWAHSNQAIHGKGRGIKASDQYVAALCRVCHYELDQGKRWDRHTKVYVWTLAHERTVRHALACGLWPEGVAVPEITTLERS